MSSSDDPMFGCRGFGLTEMPSEDEGPKFGFYLSPRSGPGGEDTFGLQLGCCNDSPVCWIAEFTVHRRRDGVMLSPVKRKVAITPCSGHCKIPGPYENSQVQAVSYKPPEQVPPVTHTAVWVGDGESDSIDVHHPMRAKNVVAIVTGPTTQQFSCRVLNEGLVQVHTIDGSPLGNGIAVTVVLRLGKEEKKKFRWSGDGMSRFYDVHHNFNSSDITINPTIMRYPDESTPPIGLVVSVVDSNTARIGTQDYLGNYDVFLPAGYEIEITVIHVRPYISEDEEEEEEDGKLKCLSHNQFSWGGTLGMSNVSNIGESTFAGIQIMGVHFGQKGFYNPELDGRKARIMFTDGNLVGLMYGSTPLGSDRGIHPPAINWQSVTECMWDGGASYSDTEFLAEGEWPLDEYGDMIPSIRTEAPYNKDFFFTCVPYANEFPLCTYVHRDVGIDEGGPFDMVQTHRNTYYGTYPWSWPNGVPFDNIWHGRCNFEYRAAYDADSWLRSNGPTLIIGGAVYKADMEMMDYIANEGQGWFSLAENQKPYRGPVPPLPASKLLLPTFPNGLVEPGEEDTEDGYEYRYFVQNGVLPPNPYEDPPTEDDPPRLDPDRNPKYNVKYPFDWDETITEEIRAYWGAKGWTVSPWYQHPKIIAPDALSEIGGGVQGAPDGLIKPFYDASTLQNPGFNTEVVGFTLESWRKCGEKHMCAKRQFPVFTMRSPGLIDCISYDETVQTNLIKGEHGTRYTIEMKRWPGPLIPNIPFFNRGRSESVEARWVGDGISSIFVFEHELNTDTPLVEITTTGTSPEIYWYAPSLTSVIFYTFDPVLDNAPGDGPPLPPSVVMVAKISTRVDVPEPPPGGGPNA